MNYIGSTVCALWKVIRQTFYPIFAAVFAHIQY